MSLFSKFFGKATEGDLEAVADYMREDHSALYRHYAVDETQYLVQRGTGIPLSREQTIQVMQRLRDEKGYGPIDEWNLWDANERRRREALGEI